MSKTVLITGASSGIGKATAQLFALQGWNVAATARSPESIQDLKQSDHMAVLRLDVTDPSTIQEAVAKALDRFGRIDVLVNNAGFAVVGPFEASTTDQIQRQFATNVFGLFEVTRSLLQHFREQRAGTIVNITSQGGRIGFPFASLYNATKWAVEGFSESLQYELEPFGVRVKIVEPGPIRTDFSGRSLDKTSKPGLTAYDNSMKIVLQKSEKSHEKASLPDVVAKVIYRATTDNSRQLRYTASAPILAIRRLIPDSLFFTAIRQMVLR